MTGIIVSMTERGLPIVDGAPACPFVAYEDDREARSTSPDHRHRCFAEVRPAQRAQAHQAAYCLSSAFPVCPTFQDWARREAAAARPGGDRSERTATPDSPPAIPSTPGDERPARGPHRTWSAPPPWVNEAPPPGSLWEGHADDEAAGGRPDRPIVDRPSAPTDERYEDDTDDADDFDEFDDTDDDDDSDDDELDEPDTDEPIRAIYGDEDPMERSTRRRAERAERLGRHRAAIAPDERRQRIEQAHGGRAVPRPSRTRRDDEAPSWERPRRFEAYPAIRTRMGLPGLPRVAVMAAAVVAAGVALFVLPALLGVGGPDGGGTAASPSAPLGASPSAPAPSLDPTPVPEPTPVIYFVKSGDTLSKIAARFGISLDALLAANAAAIPDPNKIKIGDRVIIPETPPTEFVDPGATESLPPP